MRERVDSKSPVREYGPPGSVRGAPGNRRPYLDREQRKTALLSPVQRARACLSVLLASREFGQVALVSLQGWPGLLRFAGIGRYARRLPGGVLGDAHRRVTGGHEPRKRPCGKAGPASNRRRREPSCPNQAICPGKLCATATRRRSPRS